MKRGMKPKKQDTAQYPKFLTNKLCEQDLFQGKSHDSIAQNIANKTGCFIRAYNTEINLLGWGVKRVPKNKNDISIQIPIDLSGHFKDFQPLKTCFTYKLHTNYLYVFCM